VIDLFQANEGAFMFNRTYHYGAGKIRVIVYSKTKNPKVTDRGVVVFNLNSKEVQIKSSDRASKAVIAGLENILQTRDALNKIIEIIEKQKARKKKKKK